MLVEGAVIKIFIKNKQKKNTIHIVEKRQTRSGPNTRAKVTSGANQTGKGTRDVKVATKAFPESGEKWPWSQSAESGADRACVRDSSVSH